MADTLNKGGDMAKYKVLVLNYAKVDMEMERKMLEEVDAEIVMANVTNEESALPLAPDADALVTSSVPITDRILDVAKKCKIAVRTGIGFEALDLPALTRHGVYAAHVRGFCEQEVADHAMALALALMRKLNISQKIKNGQWKEKTWTWVENHPVFRFAEQTFGLVALGSTGRNVAKRAQAFGFKVIAFDPFVSADDMKSQGVEPVDFDTLLKTSDVISIHAPLSESTFHMFNPVTFEKMKKTAYLVNTARGGLVDNTAIYNALRAGEIAGAGLDVTESEPCRADEPLFTLDSVIITGHTAGYSEDSLLALRRGVFSQIVEVFKGGKPKYWLNP